MVGFLNLAKKIPNSQNTMTETILLFETLKILSFGHWNLFGIWDLVLGASSRLVVPKGN
jgi:hypothetical protein